MTEPVFLDANILVADSNEKAPFHLQAIQALDRVYVSNAPVFISRQVLREIAATLSRDQAWSKGVSGEALAKQLLRLQKVYKLAEEGPKSTALLLDFIRDGRAVGRQVHDANIVAVMLANGIKRLVTLNVRDFARFGKEIEVVGVAGN